MMVVSPTWKTNVGELRAAVLAILIRDSAKSSSGTGLVGSLRIIAMTVR